MTDRDLHILRLGQHGDRGRGGMDPPAGLRDRDALDTMNTAFVLHYPEDTGAFHAEDNFLESTLGPWRTRQHVCLPSPGLTVSSVEPEQVSGEKTRFVTSRTGSDLNDRAL